MQPTARIPKVPTELRFLEVAWHLSPPVGSRTGSEPADGPP